MVRRKILIEKRLKLLNLLIIVAILVLPYWLFDGKLFIGGDDGRLYYAYPELWLKNTAWFSWFNFSSTGLHNPQQFIVPLVGILATLKIFLPPLVVMNLAFSVVIILGFIFFQRMFHALVGDTTSSNTATQLAALLGSLFFITSPIIWAITVAPFLYAVWLIALLPILFFNFLRYLKSGQLRYVLYGTVASAALSVGFIAVPWLLGAIIPIGVGILISALVFRREEIIIFIKRSAIFGFVLLATQSFWLLPFAISLQDKSGSFAGTAMSATTQDTFSPTVIATMFQNNILYPILNLFHRSIVFNFNWQIKEAFELVYDKIFLVNCIFVAIVILALFLRRHIPDSSEKRIFLILAVAWLISLFLFTVNIGPLKEVFLMLGSIPGAGMFRNAFDKFAIGYVFIYATLISFSLWIIFRSSFAGRKKYIACLIVLFASAIIINFLPIKKLVNRPLWTTNNIYTTIKFPNEYSNFVEVIKHHALTTNNVLSIPFAFPGYAIIKDESSNNVYVGASPLKILTGINDFSGALSFNNETERERLYRAVSSQNFAEFEQFLHEYNVGYLLVTNNIPRAVMDSYIFNGFPEQKKFNRQLASWLRSKLLGVEVAKSETGAYSLYRIDRPTSLLESKNIVFKKISPVKYKLSIRGVTEQQSLVFKDTFNLGWKLYLDRPSGLSDCQGVADGLPANIRECGRENHLFDWEDVRYLWRNNLSFIHRPGKGDISNEWAIDRQVIKEASENDYVKNPDGSIDVEMTLYFYPQLYFYLGIFISIVGFLVLALLSYNPTRRCRVVCPAKTE